MKLLSAKIDLLKIDKDALFKGEKGTYLDITLSLNDEPDKYGNHAMITQDLGKERREAGERGAILGNAKVVWEGESKRREEPKQQPATKTDDPSDDIPF